MNVLIRSQTSIVAPLKFGNNLSPWVILLARFFFIGVHEHDYVYCFLWDVTTLYSNMYVNMQLLIYHRKNPSIKLNAIWLHHTLLSTWSNQFARVSYNINIRCKSRSMHTVCAVLSFVVVCYWPISPMNFKVFSLSKDSRANSFCSNAFGTNLKK